MTKSQLLYVVLGGIVLAHIAKAMPAAMEKFREADAIIVSNGDAQAATKKLATLKELAERDFSEAGLLAQERMMEICSKGLYGARQSDKDAMDYARALTNQIIDKTKRIHAFEMLGVYYKRAGENAIAKREGQDEIISLRAIEAEIKDNFKQAQQCFQRAHDAYSDQENKDRLTREIRSISQRLVT